MKSQRHRHLVFKVKCIKLYWQYRNIKKYIFYWIDQPQLISSPTQSLAWLNMVFKQAAVIQGPPNIVITPLEKEPRRDFSINIIKS